MFRSLTTHHPISYFYSAPVIPINSQDPSRKLKAWRLALTLLHKMAKVCCVRVGKTVEVVAKTMNKRRRKHLYADCCACLTWNAVYSPNTENRSAKFKPIAWTSTVACKSKGCGVGSALKACDACDHWSLLWMPHYWLCVSSEVVHLFRLILVLQ